MIVIFSELNPAGFVTVYEPVPVIGTLRIVPVRISFNVPVTLAGRFQLSVIVVPEPT